MLCGLGLVFIGTVQEGHQCHMDEQGILFSNLKRYLSYCLNKGLGFDITDRSSDLRDNDIC